MSTTHNLRQGINNIGFAEVPDDYSAFDVLNDLGVANVSSIQRFDAETGTFESAGFNADAQPVGKDFNISPGEAYLIFMKQGVGGFSF